jgi:hypothetical protein
MKLRGVVRSGDDPVRFDLRNPAPCERYEIRLSHGAVDDFLLGWCVVRDGLLCVTLTPALGVGPQSFGPDDGEQNIDNLISRAVAYWQRRLAEQREDSNRRKVG